MSTSGEACHITPRATSDSGETINSPLYEDLFGIKGDRNKAVLLYQKATSQEVLDAIEALPDSLKSYYPGTHTPTLVTVLNVSDINDDVKNLLSSPDEKITDEELLTWLQKTTDVEVNTLGDIAKLSKFNDGPWGTRFRAILDVDNKGIITTHESSADKTIPTIKFNTLLYDKLHDILRSINLNDDSISALFFRGNKEAIIKPSAMFGAEWLADCLINLRFYAEGKQITLSLPGGAPYYGLASIIFEIEKNTSNMASFLNDLKEDDYYKTVVKDEDAEGLTDDQLLRKAAIIIMASVMKKENNNAVPRNKKGLAGQVLRHFSFNTKNNSLMSVSSIRSKIIEANASTTIMDDNVLSIHPSFNCEELGAGEVAKIHRMFESMNKLTITYLSLAKHDYRENAQNTEGLLGVQSTWYHTINTLKKASADKIDLYNNIRDILTEIHRSIAECKSLLSGVAANQNNTTPISSNNILCGQLRQTTHTLNYLEKLLDELEKLYAYHKKAGIESLFTTNIAESMTNARSAIAEGKRVVVNTTKEAVIKELESVFPTETFKLPSGEEVGIRQWVERESPACDVMTSEMYLSAVEECSNPILSLLDSYKKRAQQQGREEYQKLRDEIRDAARGLRSKNTSWMFKTSRVISKEVVRQFTEEQPDGPLKEFLKRLLEESYKKNKNINYVTLMKVLEDQFPYNTELLDTCYNYFRKHVKEKPSGKYIMDYDYATFEVDYRQRVSRIRGDRSLSRERQNEMIQELFDSLTEVRDDLDGKRYPKRYNDDGSRLYANSDYENLSDEQKHYWQVFMRNKGKLISYFPERNYGIDDAIFIRKTNRDLIVDGVKKGRGFRALWKIFKSAVQETSRDVVEIGKSSDEYKSVLTDFSGELIYTLPVFYTSLHESETMDDISTDTTTALEEYAKVMTNSAAMRNIINILTCAADVIANGKYKPRNVFEKPKKIVKRIGRYRDTDEYTLPPSELNSLKMYKNWLKMQVYGQRTHDIRKIWRFAGNAYMKWVSFGTLALNSYSGISNIIQGLVQIIPTAIGGYFFNLKDLTKACWTYDKYMFPIRKDSALFDIGGTVQNNKFNLFSRKFNIMQDFSDEVTHFDETRVERLINNNLLYFFLHAGEHFLQHRGAMAMMYNEKNLVVDSSGKSLSAMDAYDVEKLENGGSKLVLKRGLTANINGTNYKIVTNEELEERVAALALDEVDAEGNVIRKAIKTNTLDPTLIKEGEISESAWVSGLSQKMAALNHYLHGIYNVEDQTRAQYYVLGRMAMMYRKYLIPALNRRFGARTYVAALGTELEGFYNTFAKFHIKLVKEMMGLQHKKYANLSEDLKNNVRTYVEDSGNTMTEEEIAAWWETLGIKDRREILYGSRNSVKATKSTLTEMQRGNLRSAWGEIGIFLTLVICNLLLDFDDDDDDEVATAALKYFMRRAQTEVGALTPASLLLAPFAVADKDEYSELHTLGMQNMVVDMQQLIGQPVVGMNRTKDIPELFRLFDPEVWSEEARAPFKTEAQRIIAKQMTPYRQWYNAWTVESFHKKEAWYKQ